MCWRKWGEINESQAVQDIPELFHTISSFAFWVTNLMHGFGRGPGVGHSTLNSTV